MNGPDVNTEKTVHVFMSGHQSAGQYRNIKTANESL